LIVRRLNLRPPISCSDRVRFRAEDLFRSCLLIILHAGKVINPITAPTAVPLDVAYGGGPLRSACWCSCGSRSAGFSHRYPMLLGQGELRSPDPRLCRTCAMLLCQIVVAVGPKSRGPTILDYGCVEVHPVRRACSEKPTILVYPSSWQYTIWLAIMSFSCRLDSSPHAPAWPSRWQLWSSSGASIPARRTCLSFNTRVSPSTA